MKKIMLILGIITMLIITGCVNNSIKDNKQTQIANPASTFCKEQNGTLEIINEANGQKGICTLTDGTKCEEWAYFRGECKSNKHTCTDDEKAAQICTMDYNPVCGNDGLTYGNGCGACAAKVDSYIKGECTATKPTEKTTCTEPRRQACTREYNPTCGYFNENIQCIKAPCAATYDNPCTACADTKVAYTIVGECPK